MLSSAFMLLMSGVSDAASRTFRELLPASLSAAEERCMWTLAGGRLEARNILIEHNLRLVEPIIKKYYTQAEDTTI
jgi:DNA-directed RNA polymerase sigma subunit (sigma70/sigma32)